MSVKTVSDNHFPAPKLNVSNMKNISNSMETIPISRLKGINIYIDNDLYDVAFLMLKLIDAKAKADASVYKSRPTLNGLVIKFSQFIDRVNPDKDKVLSVLKKHKLPMNASIVFEEEIC